MLWTFTVDQEGIVNLLNGRGEVIATVLTVAVAEYIVGLQNRDFMGEWQ